MDHFIRRTATILLSCICAANICVAVPESCHPLTAEAASVRIDSSGRKMEHLDRGVYAVNAGGSVFVSWRSLEEDPTNCAFNLYRTTDGSTAKLNASPIIGGTNFSDTTADMSKDNTYFVKMVVGGKESDTEDSFTLKAGGSIFTKGNAGAAQVIPIKSGGKIHFVWVGDFDGDGAYDYLVDRCADDHQKLEAYKSDGTYLWTVDLGVNSENKNNISPGASTIDVGMWDGATVYDMDSDGYADVLLRIADGVTFGDGKKYSSSSGANGQAIAVLDGRTGALKASVNLPTDYLSIGPMACMMEIGYLDGVNPALICWLKNRNSDKSFNSLMVAYGYAGGNKFKQLWKYDNKAGYAEAHQIRVADVNYDGRDEVIHMGYCLNSDGTLRWKNTEVVHGDRYYVGAFTTANEGNEMMCYGIQQNNASGLLEYYMNANTGKIIWSNKTSDGSTYDVARGNVGDIDPRYDGFECWSFQGTFSQNGTKITDKYLYPVIRLWWDGDLMSESYNDSKIEKWNYESETVSRVATTWKITGCSSSERGAPMFYGDILGDWREEVICTGSDYASLVIISTTIPTQYRNECLAQDPCYRNCMTAKGYYQAHMLDYYLGTGMKTTKVGTAMNTAVSYTIKNLNSDMYLAVDGKTAANGTNVVQSAEEQKWTLEDAGDGYYRIYSEVGDGKTYLLDVDYGKTDNGTNIGIYSNTTADAQLFKFVDNADGTYTIVTKVSDDSSCLGVDSMSKNEGANVLEWECVGTDDHKWIVSAKIDPVDGNLIKEFTVKDIDHYNSWGLIDKVSTGTLIYGDREFTFTELPTELDGAEGILTACDAKKTDAELAEFTAGADLMAYILLDTRVTPAPEWLNDWTKTELTATASNDVTYVVYSKEIAQGETVTLGTNGMSGSCVNYTVLVTAANTTIRGDLNADGKFDIADVVLLQKWLLAVPGMHLADWKAGDLCEDDRLDVFDLCMMKRLLIESNG